MSAEAYCPECGELHGREDECPSDFMEDRACVFLGMVKDAKKKKRRPQSVRSPGLTWDALSLALQNVCYTPDEGWRVVVEPAQGVNLWRLTWECV